MNEKTLEAYRKMINEAAQQCQDLSTLDLVWKLLARRSGAAA